MIRTIITGPAASGKDVLRKRFVERGFKYAKPYTTRPRRNGETDDDYVFVTVNEFDEIYNAGRFMVSNCYNGWKYGIAANDFSLSDVFVMTPEYIDILKKTGCREQCFIILLMPDENVRRERLIQRNDADSVERRIAADREQFNGFADYDMIITNPNF